uniref:Uncharacterized protein n=1 Tax=Anopheles albimanus TaxID=7167 RepID=A0A182FWI0_ANOAL
FLFFFWFFTFFVFFFFVGRRRSFVQIFQFPHTPRTATCCADRFQAPTQTSIEMVAREASDHWCRVHGYRYPGGPVIYWPAGQ